MPTKRTPLRRDIRRRITPEAVAAWMAADYHALHAAFGLRPWQSSPLPSCITALGVSEGDPPSYLDEHRRADWLTAQELQRELLAAAGWPDCRVAYEENLAEAESWAAYCRELVDYPNRGSQGTGCDPASRQLQLDKALAAVKYRRKLLRDLVD